MNRTTEVLTEKMLMLSDEQLAEVERFVEALRRGGDGDMTHTSASMSGREFRNVWSNPDDDVYDGL
jgi:hypothetical protein